MEWELVILLLTIFSIVSFGFFPVILQVKQEKRQSPWAYVQVKEAESVVQNTVATQNTNVDIPNFDMTDTLDTTADFDVHISDKDVAMFNNLDVSIPNEEVWGNIELLRSDVVGEFTTTLNDTDDKTLITEFKKQEEYLPTLNPTQYDAIASGFGKTVADIITCTPAKGALGSQVMIGQFFKERNSIQFDGDWVELSNEIPREVDGEFVIVKGSYLDNGQFFVQHWEDPAMVEAGYAPVFIDGLAQ